MTPLQIIYLTDPLKWNSTEKASQQSIIFNIFQLTTAEVMSNYEGRFVKIGVVFHALYFGISDIGNSLSNCSKSMKKSVL